MKSNSEETYTFIIGASFGDKTYKSLISFTLRQWSDYWKEWESSIKCDKWLYDESKSESCPSKKFSNLKFINIIIAVFIIAMLFLSLFKKIPWYSYINAWNHCHSMLFILFFSIGNYNSLSYIYSFIYILSPYFSPLIILNVRNQDIQEIIISERGLMSSYFYSYFNTNNKAEDALFLRIILSSTIIYFVFMITKLCAKQHFMKYSKAILDNSSIYYSIINVLMIYWTLRSLYYIPYYLFHNYYDSVIFVIFSLLLLAIVSLSNYSAYIDLKYVLKAYSWFNRIETYNLIFICTFKLLRITVVYFVY